MQSLEAMRQGNPCQSRSEMISGNCKFVTIVVDLNAPNALAPTRNVTDKGGSIERLGADQNNAIEDIRAKI